MSDQRLRYSRNPNAGSERDVHLRPVINSDYPTLFEIRNDQVAQHMLMAHPSPDGLAFEEWIERRKSQLNEIFLIISDICSDEPFGFIQISSIHTLDRYGFLGIAISQRYRGQLIGTATLSALFRYLKFSGRVDKLCLYVRSDNEIARSLYKKVGFRDVGELERHYFDGSVWHNAVLSEIII